MVNTGGIYKLSVLIVPQAAAEIIIVLKLVIATLFFVKNCVRNVTVFDFLRLSGLLLPVTNLYVHLCNL